LSIIRVFIIYRKILNIGDVNATFILPVGNRVLNIKRGSKLEKDRPIAGAGSSSRSSSSCSNSSSSSGSSSSSSSSNSNSSSSSSGSGE